MAHHVHLVGAALAALLGVGCSFPDAPDLWHGSDDAAPPQAPVAREWAFVAAGSYGHADDDDAEGGERLQGPTTVFAGHRGAGDDGEREFDLQELERAGFRGFSAPGPAVGPEGPPPGGGARVAFQPLHEVPR